MNEQRVDRVRGTQDATGIARRAPVDRRARGPQSR